MNTISQIFPSQKTVNLFELERYVYKVRFPNVLSILFLKELKELILNISIGRQIKYVIIDLSEFNTIDVIARNWLNENHILPSSGFSIIIFGLKPDSKPLIKILFKQVYMVDLIKVLNENQARKKARELMSQTRMSKLAIGPSSFTGITKNMININDKEFLVVHDKGWNYKNADSSYYYSIDLTDSNIFISKPSGYIAYEDSLEANVLFDKVVFKMIGHEEHYYRIHDYTDVLSINFAARRAFTNYIMNSIDRIDLMVFFGLNPFMKAMVKFGKLIHPKLYKVKIAETMDEAISLTLTHKYGHDFFQMG